MIVHGFIITQLFKFCHKQNIHTERFNTPKASLCVIAHFFKIFHKVKSCYDGVYLFRFYINMSEYSNNYKNDILLVFFYKLSCINLCITI